MEQHDLINTVVTALVTSIGGLIIRAIEKHKLKKKGLLTDEEKK